MSTPDPNGTDPLHFDPLAAFDPGSDGQDPPSGDTELADVLVNYDEIFQALHTRYFQDHARLMQEVAEYTAGFNQAAARMAGAESRAEALQAIVDELTRENEDLQRQLGALPG